MRKVLTYMKPYWAYALGVLVFLFCQSAVDLNLPNLMSDIVNVGIQQGGITEAAPQAVSQDALSLMTDFMSEEDRRVAEDSYTPATQDTMTGSEWAAFTEKWPKAGELDTLRFTPAGAEAAERADMAFSRASYSLMHFLQSLSAASGEAIEAGSAEEKAMDVTRLSALIPLLDQIPQEKIDEAVAAAAAASDSMVSQTAAVFTKGFYLELGADTNAMQNRYIFLTGAKMLLMALLLVLFAISVGFCSSRLGTGVARDMRRDIFTRVTSFTNNEYDKFGTASLITRSTNDVMQIHGLLSMGLRVMFYAPIIGIGGAIMALRKSPSMAWIIALTLVIILGVVTVVFSLAIPRFKIMQKLVDKLNLVSRENLSGMMVIRAFATQKFEEDRFAQANKDLADNNFFVFRTMATMMPIMMLIMNGVSLLIVWVGGHQIAAATMQVGDMMAFIQYTMQIIMAFLMISMVFVMVPRAAVSANRIAEVLDCHSSVEDADSTEDLPQQVKGVVEFKDVSFCYEGAGENVLEHISFTARPGEVTAFIGSTGSGKSTLVNLIPRFYDVSAGSITLDGVDIRKLPQKELRDAIGYVPQKGVLFSGDIRSNLQYGNPEADDALMTRAADVAQATEFIKELPEGLGAPISQGGTNVSGGQRQRLSIARALVKNAPVYIFDDTFSALDFKTDAKLRKALKPYTEKATMLIVAQRVSTIMHAQQIIVLDEGRIVGKGTHQELLANCKTYREIAESQLSKEELA